MEYYLEIAGIRFEIFTERQLEPSVFSVDFITKASPERAVDYQCQVRFLSFSSLPDSSMYSIFSTCAFWKKEKKYKIYYRMWEDRPWEQLVERRGENLVLYYSRQTADSGISLDDIMFKINLQSLFLEHSALILHASFVKYKGEAILFAGPSHAGKSTQAALWARFADATVINGDRTVMKKEGENWVAYGSPYCGSSNICRKDCVPIRVIVLIKKGKENQVKTLSVRESFAQLFGQISVHRWEKEEAAASVKWLLDVLENTAVIELSCTPDERAVHCLRSYIERGERNGYAGD